MEEGVCEKKHYKNEKHVDGKETECPDGTPPDDMEKGVGERKYDKNEKLLTEKRQNAKMALLLMI